MAGTLGSRLLIGICGALFLLLGALAAVQYQWSTRVAQADAQREQEHLTSAAALFATEFNAIAGRATQALQNDAWAAVRSGERLTKKPALISDLYYVSLPQGSESEIKQLTANGDFAPVNNPPAWVVLSRCAAANIADPPAMVVPVFDIDTSESRAGNALQQMRTVRLRSDHCFVAQLDQAYLRTTLFPRLIKQSFGDRAASEYEFAVVSLQKSPQVIYGKPLQPDLRQPFFSINATPLGLPRLPLDLPLGKGAYFFQHVDRLTARGLSETWELQVAHPGMPLAAAFEHRRQRDLLLSLGVELLLVTAIIVLVIGARRTHQLADQKMRFVAGVSHELRTPVSAIAMLSRNQADGLVTGADKVRQYGELIHQQSRRLNEMVEQSLQYAGIASGLRRPAKEQVNIRTMIEDVLAQRQEELARDHFAVEVELSPDLPQVSGDEQLLRTAFSNLLDNALKHAGSGRWVRVGGCYSAKDKQIQISVEDHGTGIDPADQTDIFEPFCRGRAAVEAQIPGSGLGLSLVRGAAEVHDGRVSVISEPGRGSTFILSLPV